MKKTTLFILCMIMVSSTLAFEISHYQRNPRGGIVEYSNKMPLMEYEYDVPEDTIGCKHTYGKQGEAIICLESENCNPGAGYFATHAEEGYNRIIIDCWDADNNHDIIEDNFTTKYVEKKSDSRNISLTQKTKEKYSFIFALLSIAILSLVLWQSSKILGFKEIYYRYALFLAVLIKIVEYVLAFLVNQYLAILLLIAGMIALIKYGYGEGWKNSMYGSFAYILALILTNILFSLI